MARAGYCSACGNYVFLTPQGGCSNGHGPEHISNPYEVADAGAPAPPPVAPQPAPYVPAAPQPAPYAPAAPQPAPYAPAAPAHAPAAAYPAAAAPPKKKTGLIVAIVLIVLFLCCCAGGGLLLLSGTIANPLVSAEHQKVQVAGDFFEAMMTGDAVGIGKVLPADVQQLVTSDPDLMMEILGELEASGSLDSSSWDGDVLTQSYTSNEGEKATVVFSAEEGSDRVVLTLRQDGEDAEDPAYLTLVKEGAGWKVRALGTEDYEFIRFDAETIRTLQEEYE